MLKALVRHAAEFRRAFRNHQYEVTPAGLLFPAAKVHFGGIYEYDDEHGRRMVCPNLVPIEGRNYLLETGLRGQAAQASWYLALFSGAYTPVETLTAATFVVAATEIVSNTNGYSEATRRPWTPTGAAANGSITNVDGTTDNKAAFTIATVTSVVIRGAALLSQQAKGSGAGVLMSITRFTSDETKSNGSVFNLGYRVFAEDE